MQQQQPNQSLPEIIRVKAQKGFYASVEGQFGLVNPGDVVEIPRSLAMELRASGKAHMTDAKLLRQKDFVPDYAKADKAVDPVTRQMALLTDAVVALQKLVAAVVPPSTPKTA